MTKWVIYKNNIQEGQSDKLNEVFKHIEFLAKQKLIHWEMIPKEKPNVIRVIVGLDIYKAIKEEI